MHEGLMSFKLGLRGISSLSEELIVSRDIELARKTNCPIHFLHISSTRSLQLIAQAKDQGIPITAGIKLENLIYSDLKCDNFNSQNKFFPPLRSTEDLKSLQEGARSGIIDNISLGLYPIENGDQCFQNSPFTSLSFKDYIPALINEVLQKEILSVEQLTILLTTNPRKIFQFNEPITSININNETLRVNFKENLGV